MKVHVTIKCADFTLVNEEVEAVSTAKALRKTMKRPGVAMHLTDLSRCPVSATATAIPEVKAGA